MIRIPKDNNNYKKKSIKIGSRAQVAIVLANDSKISMIFKMPLNNAAKNLSFIKKQSEKH